MYVYFMFRVSGGPFGEGSNKLLLPTQSTCNIVCVCWMYACYKINMVKPSGGHFVVSSVLQSRKVHVAMNWQNTDMGRVWPR